MRRALAAGWSLLLASVLCVLLPTVAAPPAAAVPLGCGASSSAGAGLAIPDNGTVTSTRDLGAFGNDDTIIDLDVEISITHTFVEDLEVSLSYRGNTVVLTSRRGSNGDNYTSTWFDDGAATAIADGTAPFAGHFRPEQSLNAFDDLVPGGVWELTISDHATGDTGTLQSWGIEFDTRWCDDADRDQVKRRYDDCPATKGVLPHGCPTRARAVTILYRNAANEFRGKLTCSAAPQCAQGQPVRIYKVRSGKDAIVGRGFTNETGNYAIRKADVNGQYYAVAPKIYEEGVAECKRAQSANLTL